jgi:hypothetical protein
MGINLKNKWVFVCSTLIGVLTFFITNRVFDEELVGVITALMTALFFFVYWPRRCSICNSKMKRELLNDDIIIYKCTNCNHIFNTEIHTAGS